MASINTTTTTTTSTSTRDGTQLAVDSMANTYQIGSVVTDVNLQPYIAQRVVAFFAYNMRPSARVHVFFDSVNVDAYCAPGVVPTSIADTSDYQSIQKNGNYGDAIYADANGMVAGWFNIPASTFKTGDRTLVICNVDNVAQGNGAIITSASANFTASNLSVTKQNITLTTVNPELSWQPVSEQVVNTSVSTTVTNNPDIYNFTASAGFIGGMMDMPWVDPIAQAFTITTPANDAGVFATSLDLYFKQKSQVGNSGVSVFLVETDNGYPNGKVVLPFSTVHMNHEDIEISEDASEYTRFVFEAPVFLNNGTKYAFVVKPDGGDPDYFVYTATLGDEDLLTGGQVFSQPMVGTAFYGATTEQWTALQNEYIKYRLNVANFKEATGNAVFNNSNTDYFDVTNITYANSSLGLMPGDYIYKATNSTPSTANVSHKAIFSHYNALRGIIYGENSTGNFGNGQFIQIHRFANAAAAATPNTTTLVASMDLDGVYDPKMHAMVGQFAAIVPPGTSLDYFMKGTSNAYGLDTVERKVTPGYENEFMDRERVVASMTNEATNMSGNKSLTVRGSMSTDSGFLSPLIDTARRQQLVIGNEIDPIDFNYEEHFVDGRAKAKYVSKVISLRDGMDSEDLQLVLTAWRPPGTDIQVWARFVNVEDPEPISQKVWAPLVNRSADLYSDPSNTRDNREFLFSVAKVYGLIPLTGTITGNTASANIVGSSTAFTTELEPGWYVNMLANSTHSEATRKVISIANNEFLSLESAFTANHSAQPMFLVPPPTTPYLSANTSTLLTGNVTTSTSNNAITGSGTAFTTQLSAGSIIKVNGDSQAVVSITNATHLTVGKPWSSAVSGANAYNVTPSGVTYLNSNGSIFTTYRRCQIKIILQSDDAAKVPLIDDYSGLTLLM